MASDRQYRFETLQLHVGRNAGSRDGCPCGSHLPDDLSVFPSPRLRQAGSR